MLLRLVSAALITLLLASASVAASGHGLDVSNTSVDRTVTAPVSGCDHCGLHESLSCAQVCMGSLQPAQESVSLDHLVSDASLRPRGDDLREGRHSPPRLIPPIA